MTFNPTADLPAGTVETVIVTGARSTTGMRLTKAFSWTFTTADALALVSAAAAPTAAGAQITVNLTSAADVTISIRNLAGREIAVLAPGQLDAGVPSLLWNGKSSTGTRAR